MKKEYMPTTRAKNAYDLLSDIRSLILEEPKRYNQHVWIRVQEGMTDTAAADYPMCGTVGCVAGWTVALTEQRSLPSIKPIDAEAKIKYPAQQILGLSHLQANELFNFSAAGSCPGPYSHTTYEEHAKNGAQHIKQFQDKYEAQLKAKAI